MAGATIIAAGITFPIASIAGSVTVHQAFQDVPFTLDAATSPVFNISELGQTDWALWGAQGFNRPFLTIIPSPYEPDYSKAGGTAIGPAQALVIATGEHNSSGFKSPTDQFGNDGNPGFEGAIVYEWTDGEAPNETGASLASATLFGSSEDDDSPEKDHIVIDVAASDTPQRLWVFLTAKHSSVDLLAELSDESGSLFLEDLFPEGAGDPQNDDANGYLALDFAADSPGQTLTLTLTQGMRYPATIVGRAHGIAALALSPVSSIPGDYTGDGVVDANDYTRWRSTYGSVSDLSADGNGDGIVDAADYTVWRNHLDIGALHVLQQRQEVPEPAAVICVASCIVFGVAAWKGRRPVFLSID
jgi:hypothetical protein